MPRGTAAGAREAFVEAVELGPVFLRLQPLAVRWRRALGADPRLDRGVLGVEVGHVRDQVLDHFHVRQRIDRHRALALRSEERREGKEGVSTCISRWKPEHSKKKHTKRSQ